MISIIAAIGKNRGLGKDNKLLFKISEDMKRFKELTKGHPVIMGRKTFESIGRPLPNRTNIVVSSNPSLEINGCYVVNSIQKAVEVAKKEEGGNEIFIIGGGQIYKEALPLTDKLYLTVVDAEKEADTFFPDYGDFKKVVSEEKHDSGEYRYTFLDLVKN